MKKLNLLLIALIALLAISCSNRGQSSNNENKTNQTSHVSNTQDSDVTIVYYFHGKQRCKTCIAVQDLTQKTIEEAYAHNEKVKFIEIDTSNKEFSDLVEKYEVTWNALIIAKGDKSIDLTEQAFGSAVNTPQIFENTLKEEINKIAG